MASDDKYNLIDSGLDPSSDHGRITAAFRGPTLQGWAAFGWQAMTSSKPPPSSPRTVTRTFHRPRRIR
jgi:hypothetical protein